MSLMDVAGDVLYALAGKESLVDPRAFLKIADHLAEVADPALLVGSGVSCE